MISSCLHPVAELHESMVHLLLSSQLIAVWMHVPVTGLKISVVQALLSSQPLQSPQMGIRLKLAFMPRKGPSTMGVPLMPSPLKSYDAHDQGLFAGLVPQLSVNIFDETAFGFITFTTSMSLLPFQSKSMWMPISPGLTVKVIGVPDPQPGLPAAQPE
jgi:hypothetical protein